MVCLQPAEFLEGSCGSTAGRAHDVPSSSLQNRREWSFRTPRRGFILGERKEGGAGPRYGTTHVASPSASSFSSLPKESKWSPSSACWCGGACGATMQVSPATGEGKVAICLTRARARTHRHSVAQPLRALFACARRTKAESETSLGYRRSGSFGQSDIRKCLFDMDSDVTSRAGPRVFRVGALRGIIQEKHHYSVKLIIKAQRSLEVRIFQF